MSEMPESSGSGSGEPAKKKEKVDFNERFKKLHKLRQQARKENHEQVVEEDRRTKAPKSHEAKRNREEWELKEMEERKQAEEQGLDYDRIKALNMPADVAEKLELKRKRKKNPDQGFSSYEEMTLRQYSRLTSSLKPDTNSYEKMREVVGAEQFYPSANTLIQGSHYPTTSAMDRLSKDVMGQAKRREQFHRRRMFDPDAPIDYINDRNKKFNQKLEKFYGKYTEDIRDDLERGTAV
ncbi:hypothetical protein WR25_10580 [Diploscapter pachys]|uniref:Pre-mRNA-splicing factor SYF2 n=1 Tax=Diploscapter pachys TaxID=2018661 RepID=A0A2A2JFE0_9BILA|nr:hypothetical protein WR25_10580 [Diploscapter pachys]